MCCVQTHADYEHRLQHEVNARLLKEQELHQLVSILTGTLDWLLHECFVL